MISFYLLFWRNSMGILYRAFIFSLLVTIPIFIVLGYSYYDQLFVNRTETGRCMDWVKYERFNKSRCGTTFYNDVAYSICDSVCYCRQIGDDPSIKYICLDKPIILLSKANVVTAGIIVSVSAGLMLFVLTYGSCVLAIGLEFI